MNKKIIKYVCGECGKKDLYEITYLNHNKIKRCSNCGSTCLMQEVGKND